MTLNKQQFRAFLSHSSKDKPFVEETAVALGRQHCVYDQYCFATGQDLQEAIECGLDRSALLVLFASRASLASEWVAIELDEAWKRKVAHRLSKAMTISLDASLSVNELPTWLRTTLFRTFESPKAAAREIRRHLEEAVGRRFKPIFVGRQGETRQFEHDMLDLQGSPKRVFGIQGLDGIGRRTFIDRVARDVLNFDRTVSFDIRVADRADTVVHALSGHIESYATPAELVNRQATLAKMPSRSLAKEFSALVRRFHEVRELPILVDAGGLLTEGGDIAPFLIGLIEEVARDSKAYIGIICERRPKRTVIHDSPVPFVYIPPLPDEDMHRLVVRLFDREGVVARPTDVEDLAKYCKGHPPSAYYATTLSRLYGVPAIRADKAQLVEFRAAPYVRYLHRQSSLQKTEAAVLKVLAHYGSLPLEVIARGGGLTPGEVASSLRTLVDLSLVLFEAPERYSISRPVEDAVLRVFGLGGMDHDAIRNALDDYVTDAPQDVRDVMLPRAVFRAARQSGKKGTWELRTAADMLEVATRLYRERDYERAVPLLRDLVADEPQLDHARNLLVSCLIQASHYSAAQAEIDAYRSTGRPRDIYYLSGFLARKQGDTAKAIEAYEQAMARGRQDLPVFRELALCYFIVDEYEHAEECIKKALGIDPNNRYILDLQVKLKLRTGDIAGARQAMTRLAAFDQAEFTEHRLSTVEYAAGNRKPALQHAQQAVRLAARPTFEHLAHYAKCLIEARELDNAATVLRELDRDFARKSPDIHTGLWCKWELAKGNVENASSLWSRLRDKSLPVHKALRARILELFLQQKHLDASERAKCERELDGLRHTLANVQWAVQEV